MEGVEGVRILATPVGFTDLGYMTELPRAVHPLCAVVDGDGDEHTLEGAVQGVTYALTVAARNINGWGAESSPVVLAPYAEIGTVSLIQKHEPVCPPQLVGAVSDR